MKRLLTIFFTISIISSVKAQNQNFTKAVFENDSIQVVLTGLNDSTFSNLILTFENKNTNEKDTIYQPKYYNYQLTIDTVFLRTTENSNELVVKTNLKTRENLGEHGGFQLTLNLFIVWEINEKRKLARIISHFDYEGDYSHFNETTDSKDFEYIESTTDYSIQNKITFANNVIKVQAKECSCIETNGLTDCNLAKYEIEDLIYKSGNYKNVDKTVYSK